MVIDVDASAAEDRVFVNRSAVLLARAFHGYPEYLYLFPDERKRQAKLVTLFTVMTRYCLRYGKVMASSERLEAVLMYLPPPARIHGMAMIRCGALAMVFKLGARFLRRQNRIIDVIAKARSTIIPAPHAYLFLLATEPTSQRSGHASALMHGFIERLGESGTHCYLETSDKENVGFYKRFGFDLIDEKDVLGTNITIHALLRKGNA
nr:GNAT family N-acetyltransferase [Candidatus Sigynarchaeum springense]